MRISSGFLRHGMSAIRTYNCPVYGFKCLTDEMCDCDKLCGNGDYVPFRVLNNEPIFLMDQQLTPGTYCLPQGIGTCDQKTSYHVFSTAGWTCIPRNKSLFFHPCYNDEAIDNSQNMLWDYLKDKPAENIDNPYETLSDGVILRYRCKCGATDKNGLPMINSIPLVCSVDYCLRDIPAPLPMMGFKNSQCECGPYLHATEDETSPCVVEKTQREQNILTGRVNCMTDTSWSKKPIFCPHNEGALSFKIMVMSGDSHDNFINVALQH